MKKLFAAKTLRDFIIIIAASAIFFSLGARLSFLLSADQITDAIEEYILRFLI
jgi:hypothetical protein